MFFAAVASIFTERAVYISFFVEFFVWQEPQCWLFNFIPPPPSQKKKNPEHSHFLNKLKSNLIIPIKIMLKRVRLCVSANHTEKKICNKRQVLF